MSHNVPRYQTQRQRHHSVREDKSRVCAARIALFSFFFAGLRSRSPYLQCSPPPPKRYDLFPRKCRSTVDCLPDLCCPEHGKGVCRPPRESILPLVGRLSIGPGAAAAPYAPRRRQRRRRPRPSRHPPSWEGPTGPVSRAGSLGPDTRPRPGSTHIPTSSSHVFRYERVTRAKRVLRFGKSRTNTHICTGRNTRAYIEISRVTF